MTYKTIRTMLYVMVCIPLASLFATSVYVSDTNEIFLVDSLTNSVIHQFTPTFGGHTAESLTGIAISYDQRTAYVADKGKEGLWIINIAKSRAIGFVPFPSGADGPLNVVINPEGTRVYISDPLAGGESVYIYEPETGNMSKIDKGLASPSGIALNNIETKLFVSVGGGVPGNPVSVINSPEDTFLSSFDAVSSPFLATNILSHGYVAFQSGDEIKVFSTKTNLVTKTITVAGSTGLFGVGFTPDGTKAYVASSGNQLQVITNDVVGTPISLNALPYRVVVNPELPTQVYVTDQFPGALMAVEDGAQVVDAPFRYDIQEGSAIAFILPPRDPIVRTISGFTTVNRFAFQADIVNTINWVYDTADTAPALSTFIVKRDGLEIARTLEYTYADHNRLNLDSLVYTVVPLYITGEVGPSLSITLPE